MPRPYLAFMTRKTWAAVVGALWLWGCGDATVADLTDRQSDAVNAASDNLCDNFEQCGEVGAGKAYASRSECETQRKAFWNDKWPVASCDDRIHGDNLQVCLDAIKAMDCNSLIDELRVVNGDCAQSKVCAGE
ncbi:DUF6184 family natural product biosynthesis lipoprotein [Stigmatella aurantiaca]|uniref:Lipoprotein n=1 Tax=Stigmatella aurantiaca (strain DW4/3-1) TaxID=378806 RepID=E3FTS3_STIAD|nr:DUF6184 family natural product biosynthesis lipoprotein [Stigmatella aurantiaca]ADO70875.1 uncharacterized protein STAUR_3083 [Stigmatella aurantiaca DW4/3-1]